MMITVCGKPGSGKSTLARHLAKKFHYRFVSIGDLVRKLGKKMGLSVLEISKLAEKDKKIDKMIDSYHLKYKHKDNIVMDSRIAFHFFPKSLKIFLTSRPEFAARRILSAKRSSEKARSYSEILGEIKERTLVERRRYKKTYNVDIFDPKNYDIIIDTSNIGINEMECIAETAIRKVLGKSP